MYPLLALTLVVAFICVGWRVVSRCRSLPCPVWLHWMVELDNPFAKVSRAESILRDLGVLPGMHLLDAGCGPGRVTIPAAKRVHPGGSVTALDIQPGMLQRVAERAVAEDLTNIDFVEAGLGQGVLATERFDRAVLVTVLGEIPQREAALAELHRALKPDGVLAVTEIIFDPHFQRRSTTLRLATDAGFRQRECKGNALAYTLLLEKPGQTS